MSFQGRELWEKVLRRPVGVAAGGGACTWAAAEQYSLKGGRDWMLMVLGRFLNTAAQEGDLSR